MPKKILLVDDEPDFLQTMEIRLESVGYTTVVAHNGNMCLDIARNEKIDLILLDIMMPGKDGYTTLLELKRDDNTRDIPVIMLTAKPDMKDLFEPEGVVDYLIKPFESEELLKKIKRIFGEE